MRDEAAIEAEIQEKGKTARRITPAHIDKQIVHELYFNVGDVAAMFSQEFATLGPLPDTAKSLEVMTICVLVLRNGFVVTGESACASPENYDEGIGRKIARDNARGKIWALEGYKLRSEMADA
jgi:hypothetical protein